ncbi:MAG: CRTAC1 family protein [Deltaproteobacteria bacterium]|nr:CRTAC1 family protein [Deltaproteobacteria bacterium]
MRVSLPQTAVTLMFVGLLGSARWLDAHRVTDRVAPAASDSLARFGFRLTDVAKEVGVDFVHHAPILDSKLENIQAYIGALGASVSVADVNGDGRPDLYVTNSAFDHPNALFVQQSDGHFEDEAARAGVADLNREGSGVSMGSVWADVDNDGDEDLFVYKWGRAQLFRNENVPTGELRFADVTEGAGLERWMNAASAVWLDYDRDGRIDLYVTGYFPERFDLWNLTTTRIMHDSFEFATNGGHNVLWRNLGSDADGVPRFEDVTAAMGADSTRWTMAVAAADLDGDGWPDLYLANDYGPEELLRNVAGRRFELAPVGLGEDSKSGMAVALGDTRNRGRLDVFVTNISKMGFLYQGNNLRLNQVADDGDLPNVADGPIADCGWAWGAQFGDLDHDGWLDLYVVNGFISANRHRDYWYDMSLVAGAAGNVFQDTRNWAPIGDKSLSGYERSRLLRNRGGEGFFDVAAAVGADDLYDGRAVALVDLWNSGALDVVVANQKGPLLVYRNEVDPARDWVEFALRGTRSNRSAIGAEVTLEWATAGQRLRQRQVVDGGSGFSSQNDRRLHFGLGVGAAIERAVVRWPSGLEQVLEAPRVRRLHAVQEPSS